MRHVRHSTAPQRLVTVFPSHTRPLFLHLRLLVIIPVHLLGHMKMIKRPLVIVVNFPDLDTSQNPVRATKSAAYIHFQPEGCISLGDRNSRSYQYEP